MSHLEETSTSPPEPIRIVGPRRGFRVRTLLLVVAAIALSCWFYMRLVEANVGHVPIGIKIIIPLDITVLDDATGLPVSGARVYQPQLHPEWRGRPEMIDGDLRRKTYPDIVLQPGAVTGADGLPIPHLGMMGSRERRLGHAFFGLVPVAGNPEIYLFPGSGLRIRADGYEAWAAFLDDLAKESGQPLKNGVPLPIVVRLKRSAPRR